MNSDRLHIMLVLLMVGACVGDCAAAGTAPDEAGCSARLRAGGSVTVQRGDNRAVEPWQVVSTRADRLACSVALQSTGRTATLSVAPPGIRLTPEHAKSGEGFVCAWQRSRATEAALVCWPTDGME